MTKKIRKALDGLKTAFTSIEEKMETYSRAYPLRTKQEHEYWVRGSGLIHIPKGQLNDIPKVVRDYHQSELRIEQYRMMLKR